MKRFFYIIAAVVLAASCSHEVNPVEAAISARLMEVTPAIESVDFQSLELTDSVTLGEEITYREELFTLKRDTYQKKYDNYRLDHKEKNTAMALAKLQQAQGMLEGIPALREELKDSLDNVVYYTYKFSAYAYTGSGKIDIKDYYAFVTPDLVVLKYADRLRGMRNGIGGKVIPGYEALIGNAEEEE